MGRSTVCSDRLLNTQILERVLWPFHPLASKGNQGKHQAPKWGLTHFMESNRHASEWNFYLPRVLYLMFPNQDITW